MILGWPGPPAPERSLALTGACSGTVAACMMCCSWPSVR